MGGVVDLVVQRPDEAENHREDAAHENREEVVHAGAAAPQPVESLNVERERHEDAEQRQYVEVLAKRRLALRDRDEVGEPGLEAKQVGDDERRHPEQRVRDDVERHEQPVVAPHHRRSLAVVNREPSGGGIRVSAGIDGGVNRALKTLEEAVAGKLQGVGRAAPAHSKAGVCTRLSPSAKASAEESEHEGTCLAVDDCLCGATAPERHHRTTAGLGFHRDHPEIFDPRQERGGGPAVELADVLVRLPAEKRHVGPGHGPQPAQLGTGADDGEGGSQLATGVDGDIEPLVRHERRHDQEARAGRATVVIGTIKCCIYRGIHDGRLAIIVSADPLRNIPRVGDVAVDSAGRRSIPPGKGGHDRPEQLAARVADLSWAEVGPELIPRVSHRGVTVADVDRPARPDDRLDRAVARADDEVEGVEVEKLDRGGKKRQKLAIAPDGRGQSLHERRPDAVALDRRRHLSAGMNQAEERGLRIQAADGLEDLLAAPHARQPVVDERDTRMMLGARFTIHGLTPAHVSSTSP